MLILVKHGISGGDCSSSLQEAGAGYHKCAKDCYFFLEITVFFVFFWLKNRYNMYCMILACEVILHIEIVVN